MKILSQLMSAVPDATGKQSSADVSKDNLQSSFSAVIGATVAAAATNGDARLVKAQNVETKKTSSPESAKKNASSSSVDVSIVAPAVHELVPVSVAVPVVPQVVDQPVVIQQESGFSAKDSLASTSKSGELQSLIANAIPTISATDSQVVAESAVPAALPTVDGSGNGTTAASSIPSSGGTKIDSPATQTSTPFTLTSAIDAASVQQVSGAKVIDESKTGIATLNTSGFDNAVPGKVVVSNPAYTSISATNPTSAVAPGATNENPGVPARFDVSAVHEMIALPQSIPAQAQAVTPSPSTSKIQTTSDAAPSPKTGSSDSVKPTNDTVASAVPASGVVAATTPKSSPEPESALPTQSSNTAIVASAAAGAQPHASTQQSDSSSVSTPQPAEASVTAATQQAAIAVAVPQQAVLQSADTAAVPAGTSAFKSPVGKSESVSVSNQVSGLSKGRTASSDWRLNRNFAASDDKSDSTDAANGTAATRVVGSGAEVGVVSKEVGGNIKGALESAVLAQNAQSAQSAGQASSTPASSTPIAATQNSNAAAGSNLPAAATTTESAQAAHALNSAQLIQSVHGSEMRLGMNSAEFGNISINTSLNHQTLSAQISMDHSALGNALAMHLPAIEEKLGNAYGLQAKVELRDTASSNSTASDSSSSQSSGDGRSQGGSTGRPAAAGLQSSIGALTSSNFTSSSTSTSMAATSSRLDIRI